MAAMKEEHGYKDSKGSILGSFPNDVDPIGKIQKDVKGGFPADNAGENAFPYSKGGIGCLDDHGSTRRTTIKAED